MHDTMHTAKPVSLVLGLLALVTDRAHAGDLLIDGGVVAAPPAALPTGLSTGVGAGVTWGSRWALGARASWSTATEYTTGWTVEHDDLRLRSTAGLSHRLGRGIVGLRLGLGGTLVHELRVNPQGARAGLTGSDLQTSAWQMLPATELEATVALNLAGAWAMVVSGGPALVLFDGAQLGWIATLGVAWQP